MTFEKKHHHYGEWTKGRLAEAVVVTGPAKMIFLAGFWAEHEQTGEIVGQPELRSGVYSEVCRRPS
jgi:hypothetical protein